MKREFKTGKGPIGEARLYLQLHQLDRKGRDRFMQFLQSPFFHARGAAAALCEVLWAAAPNESRREIWQRFAGEAPFDPRGLNNELGFLMAEFKRYLALDEAMHRHAESTAELNSDYTAALRRHAALDPDSGWQEAYLGAERRLRKELAREERFDLLHPHLREDNKYWIQHRDRDPRLAARLESQALPLQSYYYLTRMSLLCAEVYQRGLLRGQKGGDWWARARHEVKSMEQSLEHSAVFELNSACLYRDLFRILDRKAAGEPIADRIAPLLERFWEHRQNIRDLSLPAILLNLVTGEINLGHSELSPRLYELLVRGLRYGMFRNDKGRIPDVVYKNIAMLGGYQGFKEETLRFLRTHMNELALPKPQRKSFFDFCLAWLLYLSGQVDEAWNYVQGLNFADIFHRISLYDLGFRISFDMDRLKAELPETHSPKGYLSAMRSTLETIRRMSDRRFALISRRLEAFEMLWEISLLPAGAGHRVKLKSKIEAMGLSPRDETWITERLR